MFPFTRDIFGVPIFDPHPSFGGVVFGEAIRVHSPEDP